jgi:hypothetical protein
MQQCSGAGGKGWGVGGACDVYVEERDLDRAREVLNAEGVSDEELLREEERASAASTKPRNPSKANQSRAPHQRSITFSKDSRRSRGRSPRRTRRIIPSGPIANQRAAHAYDGSAANFWPHWRSIISIRCRFAPLGCSSCDQRTSRLASASLATYRTPSVPAKSFSTRISCMSGGLNGYGHRRQRHQAAAISASVSGTR